MVYGAFQHAKIVHVAPDGTAATTYTLAAGTTDVNSSAVDSLGFSKISLLLIMGAVTNLATLTVKLEGSADGNTNWTDLSITDTFTAGASDSDKMIGLEAMVNPSYRYYRLVSDRGTQNIAINGLVAILTNPDNTPVTQLTTAAQFVNAPTLSP